MSPSSYKHIVTTESFSMVFNERVDCPLYIIHNLQQWERRGGEEGDYEEILRAPYVPAHISLSSFRFPLPCPVFIVHLCVAYICILYLHISLLCILCSLIFLYYSIRK